MFFMPVDVTDLRSHSTVKPVANWVIVGINVILYLLGDTLSWGVFRGSSPLQIMGYGFAHAGFWHLVMNMWILWLFGNPVNRRLGNSYYLMAYLGTLLSLGLFAFLFLSTRVVGSSGAIFAMIGMAALLLPSARLTVVYLVVFPLSLLIGLISRPKYGIYWFFRGGEFKVPTGWCLLLVPFLEIAGLCWWLLGTGSWHWGHFAHLLGFLCGIGIVLLLPETLTMRRRKATWGI